MPGCPIRSHPGTPAYLLLPGGLRTPRLCHTILCFRTAAWSEGPLERLMDLRIGEGRVVPVALAAAHLAPFCSAVLQPILELIGDFR
jgi:hypothetical protein